MNKLNQNLCSILKTEIRFLLIFVLGMSVSYQAESQVVRAAKIALKTIGVGAKNVKAASRVEGPFKEGKFGVKLIEPFRREGDSEPISMLKLTVFQGQRVELFFNRILKEATIDVQRIGRSDDQIRVIVKEKKGEKTIETNFLVRRIPRSGQSEISTLQESFELVLEADVLLAERAASVARAVSNNRPHFTESFR